MVASETPQALDGLIVLDLSRILAGPTATQLLGDLGATIYKIENPKTNGDDTRSWGPNYIKAENGENTDLSAYFIAANRNKLSVAADLATEDGVRLVKALAAKADVVIENYKPGGLEKFGLDHATMLKDRPDLVYCSISGFGQTGPNREIPGYDIMAQGYGGVMSLTGSVDGPPTKVGVGIADVMCGMYATIGILAALRHRDATGEGQHIDLSLVDAQIAWLINEGTNYMVSGKEPLRRGNAHPNIVPYDVVALADGHAIIAVGNDSQFARFAKIIGASDLAEDLRFKTNPARLENRDALNAEILPRLQQMQRDDLLAKMSAEKVPAGPIQTVGQALNSDQAKARGAVVAIPDNTTEHGTVPVLGNPLKFSRTPVQYRSAPPRFGQHTLQATRDFLPDL